MFGRRKKYAYDADGKLLGWYKLHRQLNGRLVIRAHYMPETMPRELKDFLIGELEKTDN